MAFGSFFTAQLLLLQPAMETLVCFPSPGSFEPKYLPITPLSSGPMKIPTPGHGKVQDVVVLAGPACRWQALAAEEPRVRKHVELKGRKRKSGAWAEFSWWHAYPRGRPGAAGSDFRWLHQASVVRLPTSVCSPGQLGPCFGGQWTKEGKQYQSHLTAFNQDLSFYLFFFFPY